VTPEEALGLLEGSGAVLTGHFKLTSGRHSDTYVEKARVFERPALTYRFAEAIVAAHPEVGAVVSPAVGAIPLGFAVAHTAGARFLYAERVEGRMAFRRGFALEPGEPTLVVEDVVTTGGSAAEVAELVRASGAALAGVAALVDRSPEPPGFPLQAVIRVEARSWEPADCPLCAGGAAFTERGSRSL
jgi:orotate phosphoribosyltransferase